MSKRPVVLMVLDGYGLNDNPEGNAIAMAKTPVMDSLMKDYPFVKGAASGLAVGLPDGQMGNSEASKRTFISPTISQPSSGVIVVANDIASEILFCKIGRASCRERV